MAESSSLEIKVDRFDRVYRPGDTIRGTVTVQAYKGWSHNGLNLLAEGNIHTLVQASGMSLSGDTQQAQIIFSHKEELVPTGKVRDGSTDIPFEFVLNANMGDKSQLWESYHGVYISVVYAISVVCDRGMLKKALRKEIEFIVEIPLSPGTAKSNNAERSGGATTTTDAVTFDISPKTLDNIDKEALAGIPDFRISGLLHRSHCSINRPFTGEVNINSSVASIRSLELQLARIESVSSASKFQQEASEVMRIQIGEGNLCRDMLVPIYMVFPRLHSCPTLKTNMFMIEFEINLIVIFDDGHVVTENFPISIIRD